jgi:basic membrane protein A
MNPKNSIFLMLILILMLLVVACDREQSKFEPKLKVGVVLVGAVDDDNSFIEYSLKGAKDGAAESGLEFSYLGSASGADSENSIESLIAEGADLIFTIGFLMADATAKAAQRHPKIKFVIMDHAYFPGFGCPSTMDDCYSTDGGISNVTSLIFAEDEVAFLAGVLAACMSRTGVIASVAGMEIPPVVRFVTGYQNGARWLKPDIKLLNQYIPDFNDTPTGKLVGQSFIGQGADVIFGVGGETGNGGLIAAKKAGLMAIGVDMDQYYSFPEVKEALLSSASKNVYRAAMAAVKDFAVNRLKPGIRMFTLANGGLELAPFHDWEDRVSQDCRNKIKAAETAIIANPAITGAK